MIEKFKKADNKVRTVQGVGQMLNMVAVSPTYFEIMQSSAENSRKDGVVGGEGAEEEIKPEEQTCYICMTNEPDCIIFDCLHGGFARIVLTVHSRRAILVQYADKLSKRSLSFGKFLRKNSKF